MYSLFFCVCVLNLALYMGIKCMCVFNLLHYIQITFFYSIRSPKVCYKYQVEWIIFVSILSDTKNDLYNNNRMEFERICVSNRIFKNNTCKWTINIAFFCINHLLCACICVRINWLPFKNADRHLDVSRFFISSIWSFKNRQSLRFRCDTINLIHFMLMYVYFSFNDINFIRDNLILITSLARIQHINTHKYTHSLRCNALFEYAFVWFSFFMEFYHYLISLFRIILVGLLFLLNISIHIFELHA